MSTALNPAGLKRICTSCGVRFYDMNKRPIICPSCNTEFTGEVKSKTRRGRSVAPEEDVKTAPPKGAANENEDDVVENDDVEVVSLDDVDDGDDDSDDDITIDLGDDDLTDIPELDDDDDDDLSEDIATPILDDED